MSSRIVLALVQLVVGWFAAPYIVAYVPSLGPLNLFVYAVVFGVLAWIVGLALSLFLKGTRTPSRETLVASVVGALIAAAAITFVVTFIPGFLLLMPGIPARTYPLLGAIVGYLAR